MGALTLLLAATAVAASDPYREVEVVTDRMLVAIKKNSGYLNSNPQRYYSSIDAVLEPIVDFNYIARGVMGNYAKQANAQQRAAFVKVFRKDLVATFARGVVDFGNMKVKVVNPGKTPDGARRVNVIQEVRSSEGLTKVSYTMARNKSGDWKLINVVLNGVNLGKTFRSQFSQAMKQKGDIDKVIKEWSAAEKVAEQV